MELYEILEQYGEDKYNKMINEEIDNYNESSTLNRATFGFKVYPHQTLVETIKKHEYPGYLNFIKKCKNKSDLQYLRKDAYQGINTISKIRERIKTIEDEGQSARTKNYYRAIKSKYIDKGIKVRDCDLTIEWYENVVLEEITNQLKKLKW
jgi:hypothetical protein